MGLFSKNKKSNVSEVKLPDKIQFELNNNSNIEIDRKVYADVKFPYNDMLEIIDLIMITSKGIFIFLPLYTIGEYIGGQFEMMWSVGNKKIKNPIEIQKYKISALGSYLHIERNQIIPYIYIVLNNNSIIRDIPYCSKKYRIVRERDLYYFLGLHTNILPDIFSEKEISEFKKRLNKSNIIKEL